MDVKELNLDINDFLKKHMNNKSLYIIVIIGIVLMLISGGENRQKNDKISYSYDSYSDEERLESILSEIDGAGKVRVMITYYGTTSCDIAFETKKSKSKSEREIAGTEEDSVITAGGTPLVKGEVYPKAKGIIVIAEGAGKPYVKKAITDAASAALEIASHKVCVLEGKE